MRKSLKRLIKNAIHQIHEIISQDMNYISAEETESVKDTFDLYRDLQKIGKKGAKFSKDRTEEQVFEGLYLFTTTLANKVIGEIACGNVNEQNKPAVIDSLNNMLKDLEKNKDLVPNVKLTYHTTKQNQSVDRVLH